MKEIIGDILDIKKGLICHQTNTRGVAGAGLALQIRNMYPAWYKNYRENFEIYRYSLGECTYFYPLGLGENFAICNMYAQDHYGSEKRQTNYYAFSQCLTEIKKDFAARLQIYFPYKIGCGLAGGDWTIIQEMIETCLPNSIIVRREND
jgi:O-acetyl-ADP-ribose deacetylase (regulator of RNase III)